MSDFLSITDTDGHRHTVAVSRIVRLAYCVRVDGYSYAPGCRLVLQDSAEICCYQSEGERVERLLLAHEQHGEEAP